MSQGDVEKIKERLGIKEVVESYVKLEKAGKNYKGRCPFHNEKSPSFFVSPDRESYYCFGCGAKGDIFSFIEQFEGADFKGALKILADKAGVKIQNFSKEADTRTKRIKDILEISTKYFEDVLAKNSEAQEYLKNRGLTEKTIKDWQIGFAPDGWHNLLNFLKEKKYTEDEILSAGLIRKAEKGNYYDYFRNRIMFPISNSAGNVVAFTGRVFAADDETAKYINSPETILFKKSEILYGFHTAKTSIRRLDFSILVEGQMDTLMCHQAGYTNAVASSGTALTEKQLEIISRISPKMVIAYDSDSAGFKAAEKAWQMALSLGIDVKIAPIPQGKDPADIIVEDPAKWREIIKKSQHIIELLIDKISNTEDDKRDKRKSVSERIIPYLAAMDSKIDADHFITMISEEFVIDKGAIVDEVKSFKPDNRVGGAENYERSANKNQSAETASNNIIASQTRSKDEFAIEKRLIGIIKWQEGIKEGDNLSVDPADVKNRMKEIVAEEYDVIYSSLGDSVEDMIFTLENSYSAVDNEKETDIVKRDVDELLVNLKIKYLTKERESLLLALRTAERKGDEEEANNSLKRIGDISKEIQQINEKSLL
jgi:DNA primase